MSAASDQQRALRGLTTLSLRDLQAIFRRLNLDKPDRLAEPLAAVLEEIAAKYGTAAATLAADFYDEARVAAGAAGSFRAIPATLPEAGRFEALARWGVGPLFGDPVDPVDPVKALALIGGGLQRVVANMHRDTVEGSAAADRQIVGYRRHASANACAFCAMLATRTDYLSEQSAGRVTGRSFGGTDYRYARRSGDEAAWFERRGSRKGQQRASRASLKRPIGSKYHDDCHCIAVPVWSDEDYQEPAYVEKWRDAYASTSGTKTADILTEMRKTLGTN